ncbi:MAG: MBL fold metallo-hydrolase [Candidatus Latescibacterota bacterium]|nr:MBL fold metallo-hydrolase [Candidatus Latescibacterota bacterium]
MRWEKLRDNLFLFRDSCYVYAIRGPSGTVLINTGTGCAADHLDEVTTGGSLTVILTHHFRDHTDGALRLHEAGAEILGPYWDQEYLIDPEQHFRERQIWNSYDNRWDRFSPVRAQPVSGWMMDYEKREIAGLEWEVVPTPGATNGASSYITTLDGQRLAFVGETICGHGRTGRLAPFQYNYNDLSGAVNVWHAAARLLDAKPDLLLPSLGVSKMGASPSDAAPPIDDPSGAIAALRDNIKRIDEIIPGFRHQLNAPDEDDIDEIIPRLYRSRYANACTHFIVGQSGKILSIDYGYNTVGFQTPGKSHLSNRRSALHGLSGLKKHTGADRIDTCLVSHFHDDHVNGIPLLQRVFNTEVWAGTEFSDLLANPTHYDRPCLWHEPIPVTRHIPNGETVYWEDIPITLHPMSGHTRFATLLCLEIDGIRVAHTGDQIFFGTDSGAPFEPDSNPFTNHVYKNGLDIGCYQQTLEDLRAFQPDWILTGHTTPYQTSDEWYETIERGAKAFDEIHLSLMALGDDEIHFGAESQGGKLKPYQLHLPEGGHAEFEGWILNPFPSAQQATIQLIGPPGWASEVVPLDLAPREQKNIRIGMTLPADAHCRRQPVGLDLMVGDRPFGQVAEALVTVGHPRC